MEEPQATTEEPRPVPRRLEDVIRDAEDDALEFHGGNITRAAKSLGISTRTLQRHMRDRGIPPAVSNGPGG